MNKIIVVGFLLMPFSWLLKDQDLESNYINTKPSISIQQSLKDGEAVFKKYCISCHQADGAGVPHMAPPLIQTKYVLGDKEDMIKIVLNGLKGVEINEQTYNNPMPPLGTVLKDKEIADVLTYVRKSFGNKASAVSAEDVKNVRSEEKTDSN
jgi:mono/diheme cytochrome c family protein